MEWVAPAIAKLDGRRRPTWWIRRCFDLASVPQRLAVDIVCLGYYELYVNGTQVGSEPLAPSLSRLDKRAFICHHDITSLLKNGGNCIGIWTSSGWCTTFPNNRCT
jgi:alpha-L-rhamnosidase